jgi:peptide/nickel transport system permease protein
MLSYFSRRLLRLVFTTLACITVVFIVLQFAGDPVAVLLPSEATQEDRVRLRRELGLDLPLHEQYGQLLLGVAKADFGDSFRLKQPAGKLVLERLPATLQLIGLSFLVGLMIAIPLGVLAAYYRNSPLDWIASTFSFLGYSIPSFWLGLMAIILFAVHLRWFPTSGTGTWKHLVLPVVTLATWLIGQVTAITRSEMINVLNEDYLRTARAKGLHEPVVVLIHAFKNASLSILTLVGVLLGQLLSGAIVTEIVFAWPGMGRLAITAIVDRDWPVVQASVIYTVIVFIVINLIVDLLYSVLDPRIEFD